jgi:hypothetical protein
MDRLGLGDGISAGSDIRILKEIVDINPVKYNGHNDQYEVCAQRDAQHTMIRALDVDDHIIFIMLPCKDTKCANTYLLADAIQEG